MTKATKGGVTFSAGASDYGYLVYFFFILAAVLFGFVAFTAAWSCFGFATPTSAFESDFERDIIRSRSRDGLISVVKREV